MNLKETKPITSLWTKTVLKQSAIALAFAFGGAANAHTPEKFLPFTLKDPKHVLEIICPTIAEQDLLDSKLHSFCRESQKLLQERILAKTQCEDKALNSNPKGFLDLIDATFQKAVCDENANSTFRDQLNESAKKNIPNGVPFTIQ